MSATRHPKNWWHYWTCWWDNANRFTFLLIWISFFIGYLIYPWLISIANFQPMRLRHIWSVLWISTSWLVDRLWPVIDSPDLVANHLFDFASVWNVVRELLALSKQYPASLSSWLAATFILGDLVFFSSKVYIFTCVINVLAHLAHWLESVQAKIRSWLQPSFCLQLWFAP
jgi:hypothetical protein